MLKLFITQDVTLGKESVMSDFQSKPVAFRVELLVKSVKLRLPPLSLVDLKQSAVVMMQIVFFAFSASHKAPGAIHGQVESFIDILINLLLNPTNAAEASGHSA